MWVCGLAGLPLSKDNSVSVLTSMNTRQCEISKERVEGVRR